MNKKRFCNKCNKNITLICLTIIIFYLIYLLSKYGGEWIGFWGGIIGSVIGIMGIYWQFERQKEHERIEEISGSLIFFYFVLNGLKRKEKELEKSIKDYADFNVIYYKDKFTGEPFIYPKIIKKSLDNHLDRLNRTYFYPKLLKLMMFLNDFERILISNHYKHSIRRENLNQFREEYNKMKKEYGESSDLGQSLDCEQIDESFRIIYNTQFASVNDIYDSIGTIRYSLMNAEKFRKFYQELVLSHVELEELNYLLYENEATPPQGKYFYSNMKNLNELINLIEKEAKKYKIDLKELID